MLCNINILFILLTSLYTDLHIVQFGSAVLEVNDAWCMSDVA